MSDHIRAVLTDLPVIETERLILRKMRIEDADDMFEYAGKDSFTKHLLWDTHKSVETSKAFIRETISRYGKSTFADFGFEYKENGKFIGSGGFMSVDEANLSAELGYVVSDKYWNRGLATEAAGALLNFAFTVLKLNRVQAMVFEGNDASERVQKKLGMQYEGMMREAVLKNGEFCNIKINSILRADWEKLKTGS